MKKQKSNAVESSNNAAVAKQRINPFIKLMEDKERISKAFKNGEPLSSLTDIKFVQPL